MLKSSTLFFKNNKISAAFSSQVENLFQEGTMLCKLAYLGDLDRIKHYVENENYSVNSFDADYRTPLHLASAEGRTEIVKYLISKGAMLCQDTFGNIPIHDAKFGLNREIVKLLNDVRIKQQDKFKSDHPFLIQMREVNELILKTGIFNFNLIHQEINKFYNDLNMHQIYFQLLNPQYIHRHILSLMMAQQIENVAQKHQGIYIESDFSDNIYFVSTSNNSFQAYLKTEENIKKIRLNRAVQVQIHTSFGVYQVGAKDNLEIFQIIQGDYIQSDNSADVKLCCQQQFLSTPEPVIQKYQEIIDLTKKHQKPQVLHFEFNNQTVILVANQEHQHSDVTSSEEIFYKSNIYTLSNVLRDLGINCHYKVMDSFSNGIQVKAFYVKKQPSQHNLQVLKQCVINILTTQSFLTQFYIERKLDCNQYIYVEQAYHFAKYFLETKNEDLESLANHLKFDVNQLTKLDNMAQQGGQVLKNKIHNVIENNLDTVKILFNHFNNRLNGKNTKEEEDHINSLIAKNKDNFYQSVLTTFKIFNQSIQKTNFFLVDKSAICFQLDPKVFMKKFYYKQRPLNILMINSRNYQGFQVNFSNVSKGNVQIFKNNPSYKKQLKNTFFYDTYRDALKQLHMNKNLPESGCQANLILNNGRNSFLDHAYHSFAETVSQIYFNHEGVSDLYQQEQILFLSQLKIDDKSQIKNVQKNNFLIRGLQRKTQMCEINYMEQDFSSKSIRKYIQGVESKLGKSASNSTSFIIGGPNGVLSSSLIKSSQEKIVGIVDESGVIYDPSGLNKDILHKLIEKKQTIENYDGKLSKNGYLVKVGDENVQLANGQSFANGLQCRNSFAQLDIQADYLIVCGQPKNSINLDQAQAIIKDNISKFSYIIEASDSYFSLNAIEYLMNKGVMVFQNSSTQMGPTISSSLELLLYLSLTDHEYHNFVQKKNGKISKQFQSYIDEIGTIIEENSQMEFDYLWNNVTKGKKQQDIVGELSIKIKDLSTMVMNSNLFDNQNIREKVFNEYLPKTLKDVVSYNMIVNRIPLSYQKHLFCNHISTQFYLMNKDKENVYQFYDFMKKYED